MPGGNPGDFTHSGFSGGFLGLCIDAGQKVLAAMMDSDRIALFGAKGLPDAQRRAVRGGSMASQVVLGGQRIAVRRPRAYTLADGELALPSFEGASNGDPLAAATMAAITAGVSTRRWATRIRRCAIWRWPTARPCAQATTSTCRNSLRRSEILRLTPVDMRGDEILVSTLNKSGRSRVVPMPPEAARIARRLPFEIGASLLSKRFDAARTAAGLPEIRFHDLRHAYRDVAGRGRYRRPDDPRRHWAQFVDPHQPLPADRRGHRPARGSQLPRLGSGWGQKRA